jgi:hypothetical protein
LIGEAYVHGMNHILDEEPPSPGRPPASSEHGDAILVELKFDWDTVVELKVSGVVG